MRAFGGTAVSILLCGLFIILQTQHDSLHSMQLASGHVQLKQVGDKELETTILESVANLAWDEALAEIKQLHNRVVSVSDKAAIARYDNSKTHMLAAARPLWSRNAPSSPNWHNEWSEPLLTRSRPSCCMSEDTARHVVQRDSARSICWGSCQICKNRARTTRSQRLGHPQ